MFRRVENNIKCDTFYILSGYVAVWNKEAEELSILTKVDLSPISKVKLNKPYQFIFEYSGSYYCLNGDSELFKCDTEFKVEKGFTPFKFHQGDNSFSKGKIVSYKRDFSIPETKLIGVFDLNSSIQLWENPLNFRYCRFAGNYLIADSWSDDNWQNICAIDSASGHLSWILETNSNFVSFLGVHENIMIAKFEDFVCGIELENGKKKWETAICQIYDSVTQKCYFIGGEKYLEINPKTGNIDEDVVINSSQFYAARQVPLLLDDKFIITTDINNEKVGVFDIQTKEYVSVFEVESKILGHERFLQTDSNRIYSLSTNGDLDIFELNHPA